MFYPGKVENVNMIIDATNLGISYLGVKIPLFLIIYLDIEYSKKCMW
jgi:hypothetical protein